MGTISIDVFSSLDGVGQGPGGPGEDTDGGFPFSGWQAPFDDEVVGRAVLDRIESVDALLLGRRTYDIWADRGFGWRGSTRVGADLPTEVRMIAPARTGDSGAVLLRYAPAGEVEVGRIGPE